MQLGQKTESARAPSYFSQFFEQQLANLEEGQSVRTLYIDRDPVTFRDIARHLQGMDYARSGATTPNENRGINIV